MTEEDPHWLKAKGDDFFRGGDHLSALSAYDSAIEGLTDLLAATDPASADDWDPTLLLSVYANRSACYYFRKAYEQSVADCVKVIDIFERLYAGPHVSPSAGSRGDVLVEGLYTAQNLKLYLSIHGRLAVNYTHIGRFAEALRLYTKAIVLIETLQFSSSSFEAEAVTGVVPADEGQTSDNKDAYNRLVAALRLGQQSDETKILAAAALDARSLRHDYSAVRLFLQATGCKERGDSCLQVNDPVGAIAAFNQALEVMPLHVGVLSNRSLAQLAVREYGGCIQDCDDVIHTLASDTLALPSSRDDDSLRKGLEALITSCSSSITLSVTFPIPVIAWQLLTPVTPSHLDNKRASGTDSDRRFEWLAITLCRRGVAYMHLGRYTDVIYSYVVAKGLLSRVYKSSKGSSRGNKSGSDEGVYYKRQIALLEKDIEMIKEMIKL